MLQSKNLKYGYSSGTIFEFPDVTCLSCDQLLIIGKSGAGKSTLLSLLGGLMKPQSGEVIINDQSISKISSTELDKFRGKNIGYIFQKNHFVSSLNVLENLLLTQKLGTNLKDEKFCLEILNQLGIGDKSKSKINNLSEGEKQRVTIARAVVNKPKLILADEPTSALDDYNCGQVVQLLNQQAKEIEAALVIVTHDNRLKSVIKNKIELL